MDCMLKRHLAPPPAPAYTVTITGKGTAPGSSALLAGVTADGVTYTSAAVVELSAGKSFIVTVSGSRGYVKLNGTKVRSGAGDYAYTPSGDCAVNLATMPSLGYGWAEITA